VNGTMTVINTAFAFSGSNFGNDTSLIQVNSGGRLDITNGVFGWDDLTINAGATANLKYVSLGSQLTVNSGATIAIAQNDFGGVGANGVIAAGASTSTIDLTNNYWGTTDVSAINGKIRDHVDDAKLPTVVFQPFLNQRPVVVTSVTINSGAVQRSRVTTITVTFNTAVNFAPNTFTLTRPAHAPTSPLAATLVSGTPDPGQGTIIVNASGNQATLTFGTNNGSTNTIGDGVEYGSLSDGSWVLTIAAAGVSDQTGANMAADFTTPDTGGPGSGRIYRLFGDADGSGQIDLLDFAQFRSAFNPNFNSIFDFDGSGTVDLLDFNQFRTRYGMMV
jgi:hypothetical protein